MIFRSDDDKNMMDLLKESPSWATPIVDSDAAYSNAPYEDLIDESGEVGYFKDYEIRESNRSDLNELFFLKDYTLAAAFQYVIDSTNVVNTKLMWNNSKFPGSFRDIFVNYLLPTFKVIDSDELLTEKGFSFWEKLMREYKNLYFYVYDSNKKNVSKLQNSDELKNYMGTGHKHEKFWISTTTLI